jgi:predicted dehydrogenase
MIRLGLIGANPDRGWALAAHLPALQLLPEYEIVAIATSREETAKRAKSVYGARNAYSNVNDFVQDPDVDLVVITVKVPLHKEIVSAALNAGKNVLCEWPLGNGLAEAEFLLDLAQRQKVRHFIGLQGRSSAGVAHIRDLVADGFVGEVLSSSIVSSGFGWGAVIDESQAYLFDATCGATMLSVTGGHMLDVVRHCLGDFQNVSATIVQRRQEVAVLSIPEVERFRRFEAELSLDESAEAGPSVLVARETRSNTVPDQIAFSGVFENGALLSVHLRGGQFRSTNFLWEINGTEGDLRIEANGGTIQIYRLNVSGARGATPEMVDLLPPAKYETSCDAALSGAAVNVGRMYASIAQDLDDGGMRSPDFATAVELHRILDAIAVSAERGTRI